MERRRRPRGRRGAISLFDGGFDTAVPERPWATAQAAAGTPPRTSTCGCWWWSCRWLLHGPGHRRPLLQRGDCGPAVGEHPAGPGRWGRPLMVTWRHGGDRRRDLCAPAPLPGLLGRCSQPCMSYLQWCGFARGGAAEPLGCAGTISEKLHRLPLSYFGQPPDRGHPEPLHQRSWTRCRRPCRYGTPAAW